MARSRIGARMRARMLSGCWRVPLRVGNAGSPWPLGYSVRCSVRRWRSAGTIGMLRSPASDFVADLGMRRRPPAMSRCGPSSPQSSETRRPPRISVSMTTRRGHVVAVPRRRRAVPELAAADLADQRVGDPELACERDRGAAGAADQIHRLPRQPAMLGLDQFGRAQDRGDLFGLEERAARALGLRRRGLQRGYLAGEHAALLARRAARARQHRVPCGSTHWTRLADAPGSCGRCASRARFA